jgi:L-methionine (R)-S-oxide reductase
VKSPHAQLLARIDRVKRLAPRDLALKEICVLLAQGFPLYNWVGFYLVDPPGSRELALGPFVGEPTEHVRIPFGRGVCGQAAERREPIVVQDVTQEANYLSCSVNVRSEIVLPVMRGNELFGELDIDSHTKSAFSDEDTLLLSRVCAIAAELF